MSHSPPTPGDTMSQPHYQVTCQPSAERLDYHQALRHWGQGEYNRALQHFHRATSKFPDDPAVLLEAAKAFGERFETAIAKELLHRLCSRSDGEGCWQLAAGQCYRAFGEFVSAEGSFMKALSQPSARTEAHFQLALLYERLNREELANEHVEFVLRDVPQHFAARLLKAQLLRRNRDYDLAEHELSILCRDENAGSAVAISARYQLAYLLDELGRYPEAFATVLTAKQMQSAEFSALQPDADQELARTKDLAWQLKASHLQRWREALPPTTSEQIAFLVGAPRSGTTLLGRVLQTHTRIQLTDESEILPAGILPELLARSGKQVLTLDQLDSLPPRELRLARARYSRHHLLANGTPQNVGWQIDKNPSLLRLLPAVCRLFPESKWVMALRDPRDISISCFLRQFPLNALSAEYLTLAGAVGATRRDLECWLQMREQLEDYGREIRYEDLLDDLQSSSSDALSLLGLTWENNMLDFHRETSPVNSPTYEAVSKPLFYQAKGRWVNYEEQLAAHLPGMQALVHKFGY